MAVGVGAVEQGGQQEPVLYLAQIAERLPVGIAVLHGSEKPHAPRTSQDGSICRCVQRLGHSDPMPWPTPR